jgi:hypothetical protein
MPGPQLLPLLLLRLLLLLLLLRLLLLHARRCVPHGGHH